MLGCAHVTWVVFSSKFDSFPELVTELNNVMHVCLQNYLRCYKGTPAWYAALALASLVPITKLSDSTTASSSCLGELRRTEVTTQRSCTETLVYTLTAWNRGNEIVELAMDFIDPAFKQFRLNSSVFLKSGGDGRGRGRTVRFVKDSGRHVVGIRLLTILLSDYHNEQRLLLKHYDLLYELYSYLEGIKVVIEAAATEGLSEENATIFTDSFIIECLELLLQLVSTLDRAETAQGSTVPPFSSAQHMIPILEWAASVLVPRVKAVEVGETEVQTEESEDETEEEEEKQEEGRTGGKRKSTKEKKKRRREKEKRRREKKKQKDERKEDLMVGCVKAVMRATTFMVKIDQTDRAHTAASAKLALSLLQSEGKLWMVDECLDLVGGVSDYTRTWEPEDQHQALSVVCPSLYSHIVLAITTTPHLSPHLLTTHHSNVSRVRRRLGMFPSLLLSMFGAEHVNFTRVLSALLESCIAAVQTQAVRLETVECVSSMEELPLGVAMVTTCLMSRPPLIPLILPALVQVIRTNLEDGVAVVCSLSYLYTMIENYKKLLVQAQMEQTVHTLYPLITALRPSTALTAQTHGDDDQDDSFFTTPLAKLDVAKVGVEILEKIGNSVPCTLQRPVTPVACRRSLAAAPPTLPPPPRPANPRSI